VESGKDEALVTGGLKLSSLAQTARDEMLTRSKNFKSKDFNPSDRVSIMGEDGSLFSIPDAFIEEWRDEDNDLEWIFVFAEHYPSMFFEKSDLLFWSDNRGTVGHQKDA